VGTARSSATISPRRSVLTTLHTISRSTSQVVVRHPVPHADHLPPRHPRVARPGFRGHARGGLTDHLHEVHARQVEVLVRREPFEFETRRLTRRLAGGLQHVD